MVGKLTWGILSGVMVGAIIGSVAGNTELLIAACIAAGAVAAGLLHYVETRTQD